MPITKVNLLSKDITTGRVLAHILENVGHSLIEQHLKQLADKPYNINVDHQQKKDKMRRDLAVFNPIYFFSLPLTRLLFSLSISAFCS